MENNKLSPFVDNWVTDKGAWFPGEAVRFRGKDLFTEVRDMGWVGMLFYGMTGKQLTKVQIKLAEQLMVQTSFPDPRLWNNRVSALAGTVRSTHNLAVCASNAVSEASIYGLRPIIKSFSFLQKAKVARQQGELEEFVFEKLRSEKVIPGYGRPLTRIDERLEPYLDSARDLGIEFGEYVELSQEIEKLLMHSRYKMRMNVTAIAAALMADQGFTAREHSLLFTFCFLGGFFPCYIDALEKPEGTFFPLSCERINYKGVARREWP